MKITELRIGNTIEWANDPESTNNEAIVEAFLLDGNIRTSTGDGHISEFKPIQLTEKWLTKFGFEKNGTVFKLNSWFGLEKEYSRENYEKYNFMFENYQIQFPDLFVKSVHQLQNLYFALTGEESELTQP